MGCLRRQVRVVIDCRVCVSLIEETFFRGILFDGFLKDKAPLSAVLFSALFFSAIHFARIKAANCRAMPLGITD